MPEFRAPVLLSAEHDASAFDCGKPPLDECLRRHALANQKAMLSRTYVACEGRVVRGYATLALATVALAEAPSKLVRGMPPYPIPAILMAPFAVDRAFQGRGLGRSLFVDALERAWSLMADGPAPARLFVVDAKDESAKAFYRRFEMAESPLDPMRLFLSYKALRSLFEEPE